MNPTKTWLTWWDSKLTDRRLPKLSDKECKILAGCFRRLVELRPETPGLVPDLVGMWFADAFGQASGFNPNAFLTWTRRALLAWDQKQWTEKHAADRAARNAAAQAATLQPEQDALPPEIAKQRLAEMRAALKKKMEA